MICAALAPLRLCVALELNVTGATERVTALKLQQHAAAIQLSQREYF